ncbi:NXPE family member 3-like isoform X3 [Carcharodon carcharias]|uniref:NXPE family member 3-like isoform X3 n=1 Tax=Carcharodon carcharias TaxID=13397 RepID=UPI001B7E2ADE|nr:NXPE family member 3-like isoform X3 [Carcharodon carcharias]
MNQRATNESSHSWSVSQSLFGLLILMALLMMSLNLHCIKEKSTSGTAANWKSYLPPKFYSMNVKRNENETSLWTDRLLQCGYQIHSFTPEERSEGTFLMKMIEWPKPPNSAVPFQKSSDPAHVCLVILNSTKTFYVGDQLQVMLQMNDFEGHPKQYGGDYLQGWIHTPDLKAGSAGTVVDNQNGFYYINFNLSWPGKVEVSVFLVHPSEGIQALERLRKERPGRVYFKSTFKSGATTETTVCNLCLPQSKSLCNFTDLRTGEPWFCYKPEKLPCSARINHAMGGYEQKLLMQEEKHFFQSGVNVKKSILPSGAAYVIVKPSSHTGLRKFDLGNSRKSGPHLALDIDNKIKVEYYAHGKPIRILAISSQDLPFIANKLDEIKGGKSTIIAFTIWCHFNTFPVETYIRRLQNIRRSILRLLDRSPDTLVVIKTANVQALPRDVSLYNSDWYSYQLDLVMRKMFEGINVAFVDAWEMTIAHYLPHELHPQQVIIKNEIDVLLSYVCPSEKS